MKFIFVKCRDLEGNESKLVEAENKEEAKRIYAKYRFENDKFLRQDIDARTVNMSFWEEFFIDILDDRGEFLVDTEIEMYNHFVACLNSKYNEEIAGDLYNFYVDRDLDLDDLKEETKITVALESMESAMEDNYLVIERLNNIEIIN